MGVSVGGTFSTRKGPGHSPLELDGLTHDWPAIPACKRAAGLAEPVIQLPPSAQ
jgi:hypothetical protein